MIMKNCLTRVDTHDIPKIVQHIDVTGPIYSPKYLYTIAKVRVRYFDGSRLTDQIPFDLYESISPENYYEGVWRSSKQPEQFELFPLSEVDKEFPSEMKYCERKIEQLEMW